MLHFASTLRSNNSNSSLPRRTDSLNATQQKSGSDPILLRIEEELHDARRVRAHGQEEDLRLALDMVINRVSEMSSLLGEVYRSQADLEVQLNVAKSNLALVISNNEMLEDALRKDSSGSSTQVGWKRRSGKDVDNPSQERQSLDEWQQSVDYTSEGRSGTPSGSISAGNSPMISDTSTNPQENGRFFKFRFNSGSANSSKSYSRPGTPSVSSPQLLHTQGSGVTSPVLPASHAKELEVLEKELEKERNKRKEIEAEKTNLEAELESLSQALFEEANKMVATERIKRAEAEEELQEMRTEKEALKRALRLIENENHSLRTSNTFSKNSSAPNLSFIASEESKTTRSRSSSEIAIKSRPGSLAVDSSQIYHIPLKELHGQEQEGENEKSSTIIVIESEATPTNSRSMPLPRESPLPTDLELEHASPWADTPSSTPVSKQFSLSPSSPSYSDSGNSIYTSASLALR